MERVSKEPAIELKAVGYDVPCRAFYFIDSGNIQFSEPDNWNDTINSVSAPYLDEVINWLDTKDIFMTITQRRSDYWTYGIYDPNGGILHECHELQPSRTVAKIVGISKALELIKNQDHGK